MAGLKPAIFISILTTITIYNFELFRMEMNLHLQEEVNTRLDTQCQVTFSLWHLIIIRTVDCCLLPFLSRIMFFTLDPEIYTLSPVP